MRSRGSWLVALLLASSSCAWTSVSVGKVGPPKPKNCPIEVIEDPGDGSDRQLLGTVAIDRRKGLDPMDPGNTKKVFPRACKLGGSAVSVARVTQGMHGVKSRTSINGFFLFAGRLIRSPAGSRRRRTDRRR